MRIAFQELPGQLGRARPVVDVVVEGIDMAPQACLVDTGAAQIQMGRHVAEIVGLDVAGAVIDDVVVGGLARAWAWRASHTRTRGSPCSRAVRPRPSGSSIPLAPTTPGYFAIINASTTDFRRPFAMHLPRNEVASGRPLQMQVRRLQFPPASRRYRPRQLWGAVLGELK